MRDDHLGDEHGGVGLAFGLMTILLASVIGVIVFALTISPPSTSSGSNAATAGLLPFTGPVPTVGGGASDGSGLAGVPSASQTAACEADGKTVEVAIEAYLAANGGYPAPPSPWSAAGYQTNYAPLTGTSNHGPFLHVAPATTSYVVEYDAAGHVWVEPPGQYDTSYDAAHSVDVPTACASVAK